MVASSVAASVINAIGNTIFHRTRPAPISALRAVIELAGPSARPRAPPRSRPCASARRAADRPGSSPARLAHAVQRAANGGDSGGTGPSRSSLPWPSRNTAHRSGCSARRPRRRGVSRSTSAPDASRATASCRISTVFSCDENSTRLPVTNNSATTRICMPTCASTNRQTSRRPSEARRPAGGSERPSAVMMRQPGTAGPAADNPRRGCRRSPRPPTPVPACAAGATHACPARWTGYHHPG